MPKFAVRSFARLATILLFGAGCASGGSPYVWADSLPSSETSAATGIGVGDIISVNVFGNNNLSIQRTRVRSDGKVSLPLLNDVDVAGRSPADLATDLEKRLKAADLVLNPHVTVQIDEVNKINVSVLGSVARAGTYTLDPTAGLAEALAAAGGLSEFAHKNRIFVVRRTPQPIRIRFTFESITSAHSKAALFRLRSGDVVVAE